MHQGLIVPNDKDAEIWNVKIVEGELMRLSYHLGFPEGKQLKCPVFQQNKGGYAFAIAEHFLPTLIVPFDTDIDNMSNQASIFE